MSNRFCIAQNTGSVVDNINTGQYIVLTLVDLFVISYMGQIIQNQSVRVRDFLFETPWYRFGGPIRRSMLIIQLYTKEPKVITGGRFFIMGYDKCIAVRLSVVQIFSNNSTAPLQNVHTDHQIGVLVFHAAEHHRQPIAETRHETRAERPSFDIGLAEQGEE